MQMMNMWIENICPYLLLSFPPYFKLCKCFYSIILNQWNDSYLHIVFHTINRSCFSLNIVEAGILQFRQCHTIFGYQNFMIVSQTLNIWSLFIYQNFWILRKNDVKLVQSITSVNQFEEIFHKLLGDESVPTLDVLGIMRKLERVIYLVHDNKDIYCIMDVVDSIVQYMITSTREFEAKAE